MEYVLYTLPNCSECCEVKDFLEGEGIDYREVNAGISVGRKEFRGLVKNSQDQINRDGGGAIRFPILVKGSEIFQGLAEVTSSF